MKPSYCVGVVHYNASISQLVNHSKLSFKAEISGPTIVILYRTLFSINNIGI